MRSVQSSDKELWALARWLWDFKNEHELWDFLPERVRGEYYDKAGELKHRVQSDGVFE